MTGKRIGYIRVSTTEQNPDRQLEGIREGLDKMFIDYASGKDLKRPQLSAMLEFVREDDVIFIHSMDRMGRNVRDLCAIVDLLASRGVEVHFLKENLTFNKENDPISRLMLSIMGAIAEFELARMKERQLEGIRLAQASGRYKGRRRALPPEGLEKLKQEYLKREKSKEMLAVDFGISRATVYKYLKGCK